MFHVKNGLYFLRDENGSVTILKTSDGKEPRFPSPPDFPPEFGVEKGNVIFSEKIDDGSWCSVVLSMSAFGELSGDWRAWMKHHRGEEDVFAAPSEAMIPCFTQMMIALRLALSGDNVRALNYARFLVERLSKAGYPRQAERLRKSLFEPQQEIHAMEAAQSTPSPAKLIDNPHVPGSDAAEAWKQGFLCCHLAPSGWVVANSEETKYRTMKEGGITWAADRNDALQFARRSDAEQFAADDEDAWKILQVAAQPSGEQRFRCPEGVCYLHPNSPGFDKQCSLKNPTAAQPSGEQAGVETVIAGRPLTVLTEEGERQMQQVLQGGTVQAGVDEMRKALETLAKGNRSPGVLKIARTALAASPSPAPTEERLREALRKLCNEARGVLSLAREEIGQAIGNTNLSCLELRVNEAKELLAGTKKP